VPYTKGSNDPCATRDGDDGLDGAATGAAERMRMRIDVVPTDAMLRIYTHFQYQVHGDGARERRRRSDHEHNDHLQPGRLLYI